MSDPCLEWPLPVYDHFSMHDDSPMLLTFNNQSPVRRATNDLSIVEKNRLSNPYKPPQMEPDKQSQKPKAKSCIKQNKSQISINFKVLIFNL